MDLNAQLLARFDNYTGDLWTGDILLKRNELLHPAGTIDTHIYLVTTGALRIYHETEQDTTTIRFGYSGSLFASLDSFITGKPSVYAVQAIRQCSLKVMKKKDFDIFLQSDIQNLLLWNQILEYTINSLLERELDILATSPKERYARVLQRSPHIFQQIPHKYIASYLRMTPETLSRLQKS